MPTCGPTEELGASKSDIHMHVQSFDVVICSGWKIRASEVFGGTFRKIDRLAPLNSLPMHRAFHWPEHLTPAALRWKHRRPSYSALQVKSLATPCNLRQIQLTVSMNSAHAMSRGFNGSGVLIQASVGVCIRLTLSWTDTDFFFQHASVSATSSCTAGVIGDYFRTGQLPEPGTICGIESSMF